VTLKILPENSSADKQLQQSGQYKINSNKPVAFLYTKDKQAEKEIRETISFTIATNNIKYLGVTLTKQMKDLYDNNSKSLKKEIEEDLRKWRDIPCS
jgi:outer membrane lipopolysaccharide assembly protein LptE/RlpB